MRLKVMVVIFISLFYQMAHARAFLGLMAAHLNIEYKTVDVGGSSADVKGSLEMIGLHGGLINVSPGNLGYEISLGIFGANSQKVEPPPNWGTPWYYKLTGKINYTFSFGLYPYIGVDVIGNLYKDTESHYFGPGVVFGVGYKIKDNVMIAIGSTNNSVLYAGDNNRYIRGEVLEVNYGF
jgi:hypothetical protein